MAVLSAPRAESRLVARAARRAGMARAGKSVHAALRTLRVRAARGAGARAWGVQLCALLCVFVLGIAVGALLRGGAAVADGPDADGGAGAAAAERGAARAEFAFVFSTGRAGTQHLSRALCSLGWPRTYVTHEEEHFRARTRAVVDRAYRRLGALPSEAAFLAAAGAYVRDTKLPFYRALAAAHNASRLVYTGHVPLAFGLGPALLSALPPGGARVLRLRRGRVAAARSLMALGPPAEDPWGTAPRMRRRWFPVPADAFTRLAVGAAAWQGFNRFQRWLWYVDDVECRWQALKAEFAGRFAFMEASLEGLAVMDGGKGWQAVAEFMGVQVNNTEAAARHNSIQHKRREKDVFTESQLRDWDIQYRKLVGDCRIDKGTTYHW